MQDIGEDGAIPAYAVSLDVEASSDTAEYVLVQKRDPGAFTLEKEMRSQLQVLQLSGQEAPFSQLHKQLAHADQWMFDP